MSYAPSKYTITHAPSGTQAEIKSSKMSKMTIGKTSTISKKSKAVPLNSMFKSDVENVKSKNEKIAANNDETES